MVLILGAGESGIGAALLARKNKLVPFVSDQSSIKPETKTLLIELEIDFEEEGHVIAYDTVPQLVVKSPGIPYSSTVVQHLASKGVEIISEIEFAFRFCEGKIIAITGSNGKTTTTNLCHHILQVNGFDAVKVGNVGYSFARSLSESEHDWYVVEISSFQLDEINSFHPYIGILLNITPDHLDRYGGIFQNYVESKFRLGKFQNAEEHLIVNIGDPVLSKQIKQFDLPAHLHLISVDLDESDRIAINDVPKGSIRNASIKGRHNAMNAACCIQAMEILGLTPEQIQMGIDSFKNDPHRLESLGSINGIEFINDSKATNVDSVYWALDAMRKPVIWIVGGQDKGNDYSVLQSLVNGKVKAIVALGADNEKVWSAFGMHPVKRDTHDMGTAVLSAFSLASPGDVVLLSPACASFDLFKNYMDRGDQFRKEFIKLKAEWP